MTDWLLRRFDEMQVQFLVESWRFKQFPKPVRDFWQDHYLQYSDAVWVAGRRFDGSESSAAFDLIVDGEYRWVPLRGSASVKIDGQTLMPGERTSLKRGPHSADLGDEPAPGALVLAIGDPPGGGAQRFYKYF